MKNNLIITILFLFFAKFILAQNTPAPAQSESILITGLILHIGNGEKVDKGAIGFDKGKITFAGREDRVNPANYQKVIEAKGSHAYPGFIAPNSTMGLMEIEAVRATRDFEEVGKFNANVRAVVAYNTDSEIPPTVRSNGVLIEEVSPRGGVISGLSSVVHLDAWNWEDAIVEEDVALHLNWPRMYRRDWQGGNGEITKEKSYEEEVREIETLFLEAKAYAKGSFAQKDLRLESLRGVFDGTKILMVHANDAKQISEAVQFKKAFGIQRMVIVGGYDAWLVADMLRDNEVGVMLRRVHSLPQYQEDDVDLPYKMAKLLQDEGVLFCLENAGSMDQMGTRNLPFYAGTAKAYGLTYEQAVQSISLNTAKLLGVDDRLGSIEVGKDATFFISAGDALDMRSNNLTHAFIQGRAIELSNRQKELYEKFREKYKED
jgi:imidazolonepropionase-like amidohydrolase